MSRVRLLSYNIRYGGAGREELLAAVIRSASPDVVMLQEAIDPRVIEKLAALTGMTEWGAQRGFSTGYMSRVTTAGHEWHHPRGSRHAFLEVALPDEARLFGLHLSAWFSKWSERRRAREIKLLLEAIRRYQHGAHVIAGDFNSLAPGELLDVARMPRWIRAMVWLSGRDIARDTIGVMLEEGYRDAWRALHPEGPGYTFPTWDPHVRLDYVFLPDRDVGRIHRCEIVDAVSEAHVASDHLPLCADLDLGPAGVAAGDRPGAGNGAPSAG
jgi:endonuclease/exonuclease/phosphatase family metal-dependent hydrolase